MFWSHGSWEMSSFVRILWKWSSWECSQTYKPTDSLRKNQPVHRLKKSVQNWLVQRSLTFQSSLDHAPMIHSPGRAGGLPWVLRYYGCHPRKKLQSETQKKKHDLTKKKCAESLCQHLFSETQEVRSIVSCSPQRLVNSQFQWLNMGVY